MRCPRSLRPTLASTMVLAVLLLTSETLRAQPESGTIGVFEHWPGVDGDGFQPTRTNYMVTLPECLPTEGLVELARIEVQVPDYYWSPVVRLSNALYDIDDTALGFLPCWQTLPVGPRTPFSVSSDLAGVWFPDPIEQDSWGGVKALFRR